MKKDLIYCVSAAILAMVFMLAGQAYAQSDCDVAFEAPQLTIQCGSTDNDIEVFVDNGNLFVDIGEGPVNQGSADGLVRIIISPLGGGNDNVSIHDIGPPTDFILVESRAGNDVVSVGPEVDLGDFGYLPIRTGLGDDVINLGLNVNAFQVRIVAGPGQDRLSTFAAPPLGFDGITATENILFLGGEGRGDTLVIGNDSINSGGNVIIRGWEFFGTITE